MTEDRSSTDPEGKSWIEKITHAFSSEPRSRSDLLEVLTVALQNDVIDNDELKIIDGAMKVSEMQAREIMVPRTQMKVINLAQPLEEILPLIIDSAHSRYPIIGENTDKVLGILLAKDLLPQLLNKKCRTIRHCLTYSAGNSCARKQAPQCSLARISGKAQSHGNSH